MLKSIFLVCLLVGVCLTLDEPYKPTSPTPLSPILKALFKSTGKPADELVRDLEEKLIDEIPEVTRIICACDSKECKQKKTHENIKQDLLTIAEIKQLTEKLENILHKQIFEKIAKRSIDDDMEEEEKDESKKLIKMFEKIKNIFDLNDHKQIREFKEKIMSMSDEVVPLKVVIEKFRTSSWSVDSDSLTSDCNKKTKIFCPAGTKIKIVKSTISNKEKDKCPAKHVMPTKKSDETCVEETKTTKIVKDKCHGQKMCEISVDADFESVCECTQSKYLNMTYTCEPESETEIDRSKRSIHYRNRPAQIDRDRFLRRIPSPGAAYDYYYYGLPFDYYYGGFGPLDYYYGFGPLDYYGFGPLDYYYGFGPLDYYYGFGPFGVFDYYYDYYPAYGAVMYDY